MYIPNNNNLEIPNPMLSILSNIKNREFNIIGGIKIEYDIDIIMEFINCFSRMFRDFTIFVT